jgi:hypothetical protein
MYLPMSISAFTRRLLVSFVDEKQKKKQEYLLTLGLSIKAYLSGWMVHYYLLGFLASSLVMIGVIFGKVYDDLFTVIVSQILFTLAVIN